MRNRSGEKMSLGSIVVTNIIGLLLLGGLYLSSSMMRGRNKGADRVLTCLIVAVALACVAEPVTWFVDGHTQWWAFVLSYTCNTYCYIGSVVCSYLWVLYVDLHLNRDQSHKVTHFPVPLVPTAIYVVLSVGNLFGHYLFDIDANNVYTRQPLGYAGYVIMFLSLSYSVVLKRRYDRRYGKARFFPITLFLAPINAGAITQAMVYGVSVVWPSVAVGLALIYMAQQNELAYIDALTGQYNRLYLDATMRSMGTERGHTAGIMIDLDHFKLINDTLGHRVGDEALRDAALCIANALPPDAIIVRYAGDEFIALTNDASEKGLSHLEDEIQRQVDLLNEADEHPYKLSLSMGHSVFRVGEDTPHTFMDRIDQRMYEQKRLHHNTLTSR